MTMQHASQAPKPGLHTAAWIVPVGAPPIKNGAVVTDAATDAGKIVAVGTLAEMQARFPDAATHRHGNAALTPALINAHTHLELAFLRGFASTPNQGGFCAWVARMMARRFALLAAGVDALAAGRAECRSFDGEGVSALADIGNSDLALDLVHAHAFPGQILAFHEHLGMAEQGLPKHLARLESEPKGRLCSGHAPYSTHPKLLQAIKERARRLGQLFPIHAAEPPEELELLRTGKGPMLDLINTRSPEKITFPPVCGPGEGSIHYLHRLGLLDERTLLVHCVHVNGEELHLIAQTGAKVCLCPLSNRFLGVGQANAAPMLEHGILPALGTDSASSNPQMSLWAEMRHLAVQEPELDPATIFSMATLGGAQALGLHGLGALAPGKNADILVVPLAAPTPDAPTLMQQLVSQPPPVPLKRIAP